MAGIPLPDPRALLPPLIACLPTAFASPRPPPALLPLLSPILRQRLQYSTSSASDGWLPLLSWDAARAANVTAKVEGLQIEAHPVSGELELEDVEDIRYRRLDEETLQAKLSVDEFDLLPIYVWCETDTQGGEPGWKLSELRALEDSEDGSEWYSSAVEADEAANIRPSGSATLPPKESGPQEDADDDDNYWAAYDQTPGRTPGPPSPSQVHQRQSRTSIPRSQSAEDAYYAQYADVQPALDGHDPDEASAAVESHSTLHGNTLLSSPPDDGHPLQRSLYPADKPVAAAPIAPRPLSPASTTSSRSVERLERSARTEAELARAEDGVKRHISSSIRNLYRLARSTGIDLEEFETCVREELDVLGMLEDEI